MSRILYIIRDIVYAPLFNKKKKTTVTPIKRNDCFPVNYDDNINNKM